MIGILPHPKEISLSNTFTAGQQSESGEGRSYEVEYQKLHRKSRQNLPYSYPILSYTLLFGLFKKKRKSSLSMSKGFFSPGHCGKWRLKQVNFTLNSEDREVYSCSDVFQESISQLWASCRSSLSLPFILHFANNAIVPEECSCHERP